jgi:hypothetical protein
MFAPSPQRRLAIHTRTSAKSLLPALRGKEKMNKRHYESWLQKASDHERAKRFQKCVDCLNKAEKHTDDGEEIRYLRLWRDRVKKIVAELPS